MHAPVCVCEWRRQSDSPFSLSLTQWAVDSLSLLLTDSCASLPLSEHTHTHWTDRQPRWQSTRMRGTKKRHTLSVLDFYYFSSSLKRGFNIYFFLNITNKLFQKKEIQQNSSCTIWGEGSRPQVRKINGGVGVSGGYKITFLRGGTERWCSTRQVLMIDWL